MHIGLQDWGTKMDMRKITLSEMVVLGTYTYTFTDLQATVAALDEGIFGDLSWVESRPLDEGPAAFRKLAAGKISASKIVLLP